MHLIAIGRGGLASTKREGDGATPRCRVAPVAALAPRRPRARLPWRRVRGEDGWCDAPASGQYNRRVRRPFAASHEALARTDGLYDHLVVTDHNQRPRVRGAGSAIFVHVARPALSPTEGCLAFARAEWEHGRVPLGASYLIGVDPRPCR